MITVDVPTATDVSDGTGGSVGGSTSTTAGSGSTYNVLLQVCIKIMHVTIIIVGYFRWGEIFISNGNILVGKLWWPCMINSVALSILEVLSSTTSYTVHTVCMCVYIYVC